MYRTPNEISQTQLHDLRLMMVEDTLEVAALYPLVDRDGKARSILVDLALPSRGGRKGQPAFEAGRLKLISEFPMEVRLPKAIYSRPVAAVIPADRFTPEMFAGLAYLDPWDRIPRHADLSDAARAALQEANLGLKRYRDEAIEDLFFTLDLKKISGASARRGLLSSSRVEMLELLKFMRA